MTPRPVALSMFPEMAPDRAVGRILGSVFAGSNADLIAAVAPLYLTGSVLDFRALPEADRSIDAVCFDPPYIPQHSSTHSTLAVNGDRFLGRYGLENRYRQELFEVMAAGLAECARVARRWVLVKCTDFTNNRALHLGHVEMIRASEQLPLRVHDLIVHHTGSGPGGSQIMRPVRARRHHSYLLVFRVTRRRRTEVPD